MELKEISFDLYRYQLLPITQNVQPDMYRKELTLEKLKEIKNELFFEVLDNLPTLKHRSLSLQHKSILKSNDWFAFKLGAQKTIERENKNFIKEKIESWPHVTVIINNDPSIQLIAISRNLKAFSGTSVVAKILESSLREHLLNMQLTLQIESIFDKKEFWSLIEKYQGKLTSVKFELISPNMANISKAIKIDLKQINTETNSHRTNIELNAAEGTVLEIDPENEILDSLVNYASEGGGDISMKIKGLKKKIHTKTTTKTMELDELTVDNLNENSLYILLESLKP